MDNEFKMHYNVGVIGAGSWGTALASLCADNLHNVLLYGRDSDVVCEINNYHTNKKYLGDSLVNENVKASTDLFKVVGNAEIIIIAIPSFSVKQIMTSIKDHLKDDVIIVNVAKGFDKETLQPFSKVISKLLPYHLRNNVASLLGPTFAEEVISKEISAISVTSTNFYASKVCQHVLSNHYFRVYINNDVIGCEYCAALKNVIALAAGMVDGLGCKVNTRAALITRGMSEIKRYVLFFGGHESTALSLAGIGDLILTCSSMTSRNYSAGYMIGKYGYAYFLEHNKKTTEGIFACEYAYQISKKYNIYSPIVSAVYNVITEKSNVLDTFLMLMHNELKDQED